MSNQFINYQKPKVLKNRYRSELSDGHTPNSRDAQDWGPEDHQNHSSSQNNSFAFGSSYPRKLEPQPLIVNMKNLAKKRMSGSHHRGGEFQKDLKGAAPRRNTK